MTEVSVKNGDISIGSTSGILKAVTNTGNIDISLSRHNNVILETKKGKLPLNSIFFQLYHKFLFTVYSSFQLSVESDKAIILFWFLFYYGWRLAE